MRPDPNDLFQAYPFDAWHEDFGDVLWWLVPVGEPPYCGSPLDMGRDVSVTIQIGTEVLQAGLGMTGGWPFYKEDEPNLVWTLLPGSIRMPSGVR